MSKNSINLDLVCVKRISCLHEEDFDKKIPIKPQEKLYFRFCSLHAHFPGFVMLWLIFTIEVNRSLHFEVS